MKAYCKHCKHFIKKTNADTEAHVGAASFLGCGHPEVKKYIDKPLGRLAILGDCCKVNKDNDCELYLPAVPGGGRASS